MRTRSEYDLSASFVKSPKSLITQGNVVIPPIDLLQKLYDVWKNERENVCEVFSRIKNKT